MHSNSAGVCLCTPTVQDIYLPAMLTAEEPHESRSAVWICSKGDLQHALYTNGVCARHTRLSMPCDDSLFKPYAGNQSVAPPASETNAHVQAGEGGLPPLRAAAAAAERRGRLRGAEAGGSHRRG